MAILVVEAMDLGPDVRAASLELVEGADHEPLHGSEAAQVWSSALPAIAAQDSWALDFFSHLEPLREYCEAKKIEYREASERCIVIPALGPEDLSSLLARFEHETIGVRAGNLVSTGDVELENELSRQGGDAYHRAYSNYHFCAICDLENGSVVVLSAKLWASEIVRRLRPRLSGMNVEVRIGA
ncbi:MAG TPA: hypothetical protein VGR81_10680 [Candidatus Acidoferrales bacterium]|nr:hypothetical protein [Candidatus Acidoferrales bacterium]